MPMTKKPAKISTMERNMISMAYHWWNGLASASPEYSGSIR